MTDLLMRRLYRIPKGCGRTYSWRTIWGTTMTQITQFLRRAVQTNGGDIATICGERTQTWNQFGARVGRLAGALQGLGYGPGDRVGILALNADRYLEAFFGLATAGVIFV